MFMTLVYFIVVIVILHVLYNYFTSSSSRIVEQVERRDMVEGSRNASQYKLYGGDNLPVSRFSNSFTISFWVYINDYKYSLKENKYILMKGNKDESNDSPIIYLTPYQNNLVVRMKLQSQEDPTKFENNEVKKETHTNNNQTFKEDSSTPALNNTETAMNKNNNTDNNNSTMNPVGAMENAGNMNNTGAMENASSMNENNNTSTEQMPTTSTFTNTCMNLPTKNNFETKEAFGNISNNSAPLPSVSYNKNFYAEINGENLKETVDTIENETELNSNIKNVVENFEDHNDMNTTEQTNNTPEDKYDECMIQNIPLQKWVHVAVSVYNNVLDIYQDGKLKSSCVLRGFPEPPIGEIHLTPFGGFSGKVASVSGFNKAISQDMAYDIYREGPNKQSILSFFSNLITFN